MITIETTSDDFRVKWYTHGNTIIRRVKIDLVNFILALNDQIITIIFCKSFKNKQVDQYQKITASQTSEEVDMMVL